jgi:hypothetical protein
LSSGNSKTADSPPAKNSVEPKNVMDRKQKSNQVKKSDTVVLDYNTGFEAAENESLRN